MKEIGVLGYVEQNFSDIVSESHEMNVRWRKVAK